MAQLSDPVCLVLEPGSIRHNSNHARLDETIPEQMFPDERPQTWKRLVPLAVLRLLITHNTLYPHLSLDEIIGTPICKVVHGRQAMSKIVISPERAKSNGA